MHLNDAPTTGQDPDPDAGDTTPETTTAAMGRRRTSLVARLALVTLAAVASVGAIGGGRAFSVAQDQRAVDRLAAVAERAAKQAEHAAFTGAVAPMRAQTVRVGGPISVSTALTTAGLPLADVERALSAAAEVFDTGRLRDGQEIGYSLERGADGRARLAGLSFYSDPGHAVTVTRLHDGRFAVRELSTPLKAEVAHIAGAIEGSFYSSAIGAGATDREVAKVADVFAFDIDFQRDVRAGDPFEMVFEREYDELGRTVLTGDLMFVSMKTRNGLKSYYRFLAPGEKEAGWFDEAGKSAKKFLMRTPINGARLSSNFGMRRHPILGYSKLHRGTDFAAPTGTPIFAAGDGVITRAGRNGGYGNYVSIKHDDRYTTAYAHLSRFAGGMRAGRRVSQGQIIGYVGSTGASTGPHLHYEVLYRGKQINPMSLQASTTGRILDGAALKAFTAERDRIDALRGVAGGNLIAQAPGPQTPPAQAAGGAVAPSANLKQ